MSNNTHGPPRPDSFHRGRPNQEQDSEENTEASRFAPGRAGAKPTSPIIRTTPKRDRSSKEPSQRTQLTHQLKEMTRRWVKSIGYKPEWVVNKTGMSLQSAKDLLNPNYKWKDGPTKKFLKQWIMIPKLPDEIRSGLRDIMIMLGFRENDIPVQPAEADIELRAASNDAHADGQVIAGRWPTECAIAPENSTNDMVEHDLQNKPKNLLA